MPTVSARRGRRTAAEGLWLALGLTALLLSVPLGFGLVTMGAPEVWTPLFVALVVLAGIAGYGFLRVRRRGELPR